MLALLKGFILEYELTGRSLVPDRELHQISAREGFRNAMIVSEAEHVLRAVEKALHGDPDEHYLFPLKEMLLRRTTPAETLIHNFQQSKSVVTTLKHYGSITL